MESISINAFAQRGIVVLLVAYLLIFSIPVFGQYDLSWYTIDGGGGTSSGGTYVISGTIGQPDAASSNGGNYGLFGGFWPWGPPNIPGLKLTKTDDIDDGACIGSGDYITYTIDYNYPAGPNLPDIDDVNIIDYLPEDVEYLSSDPCGFYDPCSRTVTWNIGTIQLGGTNSISLKVRVICPSPGDKIRNTSEIRSGNSYNEAEENTSVCCYYPTFTNVDNITDCVNPGGYITYNICYTAHGYGDSNVVIIDDLPSEVNFVSAIGDWIYNSGTVIWNIGRLEPYESGCVTLTVKVKRSQPEGTITNPCQIRGDCISPVNANENTNICSWYPTQTLIKVDNITGCANPGENITYTICYDANGYGDTNVEITDELPDEVNFVSATGDYEYISGMVTWNIGTLEPNESGCFELVVKVNTKASPLIGITNCSQMSGDCIHDISACESTCVCWPPEFTMYIDANATGANNGTSWQNAFINLQDAIGKLLFSCSDPNNVEIWVADGTYKPDEGILVDPNDRNATFQLINGVKIKGGYAGYGATDPNVRGYETILSGDIGTPDVNTDNSYHVVTANSVDGTAVLDGFTITAGNSIGSGGGMYNISGSPTVTNCIFTENMANVNGGGMDNISSNPTVTNCIFTGNMANTNGGGIYNSNDSDAKITNCVFSENLADYGGGVCNNSSSPRVINCTFTENIADTNGGGMCNNNSSPVIINCILWGNTNGLQIYDSGNSCPIVAYSDIQGGWLPPWDPDADPDLKFNMDFETHDPCTCTDLISGAVARITDFNDRFRFDPCYTKWDPNNFWDTAHAIRGTTCADFGYYNDHLWWGRSPNDVNLIMGEWNVAHNELAVFDLGNSTTDKQSFAFWFNDVDVNEPGHPTDVDANLPGADPNWPVSLNPNTPGYLCQRELGESTIIRYAYRLQQRLGLDEDKWWEIRINTGRLEFREGRGHIYIQTTQPLTEMSVDPNTWHHAVIALDRTTETGSKIYIDGIEVPVNVIDYKPVVNSTFDTAHKSCVQIGAGKNSGTLDGYEFDGKLDEIRVYHKALTACEARILSEAFNNNINLDPCFVNPVEGNYRLLSDSPCIDAGHNNSVPPDYADLDGDSDTTEPMPFDLDGHARIADGDGDCNEINVDMGAYEFCLHAYAYLGDFDCQCDVDFQDLAVFADAWLTEEGKVNYNPICDISIPADQKINMLDFAVFANHWRWGTEP